MSAPRLQDVIRSAVEHVTQIGVENDLTDADLDAVTADALAAWREVCTVRTVEQLDALPARAVVLDSTGVWHRAGRYSISHESWFWWWWRDRSQFEHETAEIKLPALLVWHPDWEAS